MSSSLTLLLGDKKIAGAATALHESPRSQVYCFQPWDVNTSTALLQTMYVAGIDAGNDAGNDAGKSDSDPSEMAERAWKSLDSVQGALLLKIYLDDSDENLPASERLQKEQAALMRLVAVQAVHVPLLFGVVTVEGITNPALALQYLTGRTLRGLRDHKLSSRELTQIARCIEISYEAISEKGVVHGDNTLDNMMIIYDKDTRRDIERTMLVDFDSAENPEALQEAFESNRADAQNLIKQVYHYKKQTDLSQGASCFFGTVKQQGQELRDSTTTYWCT